MIKSCFIVALISLSGLAMAQTPTTLPATMPTTEPSTQPTYLNDASYGIGFQFAKQIKDSGAKLNPDAIAEGLRDGMAGSKSKISPEAFANAMQKFQQDMAAAAGAEADKNVKLGEAYREENGKKKGVTTTKSGLQIETIAEGTGASPKATDNVKVHYTGTLIDGTKFDSSVDRGQPAMFPLNGVIPAWTEGLQLMKIGGKARLVVPPTLGYGPNGQGPIPPNATLVFDVELISIEK